MKPKISIVVTCYNHEKFIKKCLDGIVKQKNCPPFEVIIGDDCSIDNTRKIIRGYLKKHKNIKMLERKKNLGMLNNLKDCFEKCHGDYIAVCEGDDYWIDSEKLKQQYDALSRDSEAYFCFSDIKLLSQGKYIAHIPEYKKNVGNHINISDMLSCNYVANFSCVMYKRTALKFIPDFYWTNKLNADYVMHLYMLQKSKYAIFLKKKMSVYRILPDSISHKDTYPMNVVKFIRMMEIFNINTKNIYQDQLDLLYTKIFPPKQENKNKQYKRIFGISFPCFSKRIMVGIGIKRIINEF